MKVSFKDRLVIQGVLMPLMPTKGGYVEMLQLADLRAQTVITADELREYNFRDGENGQILWDIKDDEVKEISLSEAQIDFLQLSVWSLDEQKLISEDILPLCKSIMEIERAKPENTKE